MLKVIRVILAVICLLAVTFLFLDFTGIGVRYFGWLAKWQFIPALLSTAVGPLERGGRGQTLAVCFRTSVLFRAVSARCYAGCHIMGASQGQSTS